MEKPVVVVSSCLTGENVRYDGKSAKDPYIEKLSFYFEWVKVCPEVEIGLGVPRKKVFLWKEKGKIHLIQEETGKDYTERIVSFSEEFLKRLDKIDGFLLKAKSPSCGITGAKTYHRPDRKGFAGRHKGLFASAVIRRFPSCPVADELLLQDWYHRYLFLTGVYTLFKYRTRRDELFSEGFLEVLKRLNRKRSEEFITAPTFENLLGIFRKKPPRNRVKELISKGKFVFPQEMFHP